MSALRGDARLHSLERAAASGAMTAMDWSRLLHLSLSCGEEVRGLVARAFADSCATERAPPGYVTLAEAARIAGVSKGSIHHAAARGAIRSGVKKGAE